MKLNLITSKKNYYEKTLPISTKKYIRIKQKQLNNCIEKPHQRLIKESIFS